MTRHAQEDQPAAEQGLGDQQAEGAEDPELRADRVP